MRLDRVLSELGVGSRSMVRELVRKKRVSVNGEIAGSVDMQVPEGAEIRLDGEILEKPGFIYLMLHKPAGFLTAVTDRKRPVVMELVESKRKDLAPVGRLDLDTEGLLLITNDGALAHQLLSPKNRVAKKYYVETDVLIPENAGEILSKPVVFKEFTSLPAVFEKISERSAYLTVYEGRFHEVKRLFHAVGCEVTYLKRVAFGPLELGDLPKSALRKLTDEEVHKLRDCISSNGQSISRGND